MNTIIAQILLCSSLTSPPACTDWTAQQVIVQPTSSELTCMRDGQALIAGSALREDLAYGSYVKIACLHRKRG